MRTAVVGLPLDYAYPGDTRLWWRDTTAQAANLGAAFITRSLVHQLGAESVPVTVDPTELADRYDRVVLALATHLHRRRDVSPLLRLVEAVDLPVHAFSLGMEDYLDEDAVTGSALSDYRLDPTVHRLLSIVADRSDAIGCRGPWSAEVLAANGFDRVVPFGCPSAFWQLTPDIAVSDPVIEPASTVGVFHRSLVDIPHLLHRIPLWLGQDFQDQALMTGDLQHDTLLIEKNRRFLEGRPGADVLHAVARSRGVWPRSYAEWIDRLVGASFVVGPRLHGCVAALAHGVPALLLTRDVRTREMVQSLGLPALPLQAAGQLDLADLVRAVDLDAFRVRYRSAFAAYRGLLDRLGVPHRLGSGDEVLAGGDETLRGAARR